MEVIDADVQLHIEPSDGRLCLKINEYKLVV